jgi:pantoate--beta-alanine ligase
MIKVWDTIPPWMEHRRGLDGRTIGFVPTMGALHRGHAALIEQCRRENDIAIVSIFINPTQFNDPSDLARYPKTFESDLSILQSMNVDHVLAPRVDDLYPNGYRFRIEEHDLTTLMEGVRRPGFLQGVMTIVLKLLNVVRPQRAYFGEKDYQQLQIVRNMVNDLFVPVEIIGCPTVRETSGLAFSSRNSLLSAAGRQKAALISEIVSRAQSCRQASVELQRAGFEVEYVEEHFGRRFVAAWLEGVRLIDNLPSGFPMETHASLSGHRQ